MSDPRRAARTRAASWNASRALGEDVMGAALDRRQGVGRIPGAPTSTTAMAKRSGSDLISPTSEAPASRSSAASSSTTCGRRRRATSSTSAGARRPQQHPRGSRAARISPRALIGVGDQHARIVQPADAV